MPFVSGPGISSFSNIKLTPPFEIIAGANVLIPAKRLILCLICSDIDTPDLRIEAQGTVGWLAIALPDLTAAWAPLASVYNPVPIMIISDGVNWRIRNTGANPVTAIQYWYMDT
jgi:hypothetical protein